MSRGRWTLLALALFVATLASEPVSSGAQGRGARPWPSTGSIRLAYYYPPDPGSMDSLRANLHRLDIVAPHWISVDESGHVDSDERPDAVTLLREGRAVVLPSVVVSDASAAHRVVSDPTVRSATIAALVAAVAPWDGLALDFEGLDAADRADLSHFMRLLGVALREAGKYYAIALPAKTSDIQTGWSGAFDYPAIAGAADLYLVMAYGWRTSASRDPGSTAPLTWIDACMEYAVRELPPDRVLLGVPFYGYDWNVTRGPPARALRHRDVPPLLDRHSAQAAFMPEIGASTFTYRDGGDAHEVWYEDARSLSAKLDRVGKYRLRGAGAWRLGQEDPNAWSVWDRALGGGAASPPPGGAILTEPTNGPSAPVSTGRTTQRPPVRAGWLPTLWGGSGELTSLTVTNPNAAAATVSITLFQDDDRRTRIQRLVSGGDSTVIELGGPTSPDAAAGFTANLPVAVESTVHRSDGARLSLPASEPGTRWIFPDAQAGSGFDTSLAILNPSPERARVSLRARSDSGSISWEHWVLLDSGKRAKITIPEVKPPALWVEATADIPVVAARHTRSAGAAQGDAGVLPARRWSFADSAPGESWLSYVVVANPGAAGVNLRVRWSATAQEQEGEERTALVPALGRVSIESPAGRANLTTRIDVDADQPVAAVRSAYERNGVGAVTHIGVGR